MKFSPTSFAKTSADSYQDIIKPELWSISKFSNSPGFIEGDKLHNSVIIVVVNHLFRYYLLTKHISKNEYKKNYLGQNISKNPFYFFTEELLIQRQQKSKYSFENSQ